MLRAFDEKSLYPSAMIDKDSFYPQIETGYLFTPDKEDFRNPSNNRSFTQFKDQASTLLIVRYYNPKSLIFQHSPVKQDVISDGKR